MLTLPGVMKERPVAQRLEEANALLALLLVGTAVRRCLPAAGREGMQRPTTAYGSQHLDQRRTPVRCWRLPVTMLVLVLLGACARNSANCVGKTWDLRTPPRRAALGMPPGKTWFVFQCDTTQEITFDLPGDVILKLPSTLVTVDAYGAAVPETDDPATVDVHTGPLSIDAAAKTTHSILTT